MKAAARQAAQCLFGAAVLCACSQGQDTQPTTKGHRQEAPLATMLAGPKGKAPTPDQMRAAIKTLRPLHKKLGKPRRGDWLESHVERGQSFEQYLRFRPVLPRGKRKVIYIQPVGDMDEVEAKIVRLTARYMALHFGTTVKVLKRLPLKIIPQRARRERFGNEQILTTYVLDKVLKPRLPVDAAAFLAFTAQDLWPGKGWNFVFGQASLRERVGVWSMARNGDPSKDEAGFRLCLLRTLKTATHETGHMFSMQHCIAFECNQCGSNSRAESDRRPLALCPECMAKVCWGAQIDPRKRYESLQKFCKKQGLEKEADFFARSIQAFMKK